MIPHVLTVKTHQQGEMYCFQNVQTLCNFFPFLLSLKVSNQSFKNGSHLPFSEILDDLAKTSLSSPRVVVDRHVGPHVVQGVVGVAVVVVPVVVRVLNRVLRCVGRADRRSVVVCVGECHVGGGIWGENLIFILTQLLSVASKRHLEDTSSSLPLSPSSVG